MGGTESRMSERRPLIFICHSSRDKPFVRELADRLASDGVDSWIDEMEIRVGDSLHENINGGLAKSDFLVVVLSSSSVESQWVRNELSSAASLEKLRDQGVFILPALLEPCEVPPLLLDRRYANFAEDRDAAYQELLDGIFHHFAARHPEVSAPDYAPTPIDDRYLSTAVEHPDQLFRLAPREFEELVSTVFQKLGYQTEVTPVTKDGGADVVATAEVPGLSPFRVVVECKRYAPENAVGVDIVRQLAGAMQGFGVNRGVVVTTSGFSEPAREAARAASIDLIDAGALLDLIKKTRR